MQRPSRQTDVESVARCLGGRRDDSRVRLAGIAVPARRGRCTPASVLEWRVHELTRTLAIPHRKLPGSRRCLFLVAELEAWEAGSELEAVELRDGGRIVRPKGEGAVR
jgi:hypothetical protein